MSIRGVGDPCLDGVVTHYVRNDVKLFITIVLISIIFNCMEIAIFRVLRICCYLICIALRILLKMGFSLVSTLKRFKRRTNIVIYQCRYVGCVRKRWRAQKN